MSKKKKILISIFSILLCVLISFAWINEIQTHQGRVLALRFEPAAAATSELEVKLSVNVEEDIYEEITAPYPEDYDQEKPKLASYDDFAPGSRKKFKVDIINHSEESTTLRILLSDIICENDELRNSIIIGTNGFAGFDANYPAPEVQNKLLSVGTNEAGNFVLVDQVELPPANKDKPVTIYFYVMFTASGSENLEDMTFSIGTINFLTL